MNTPWSPPRAAVAVFSLLLLSVTAAVAQTSVATDPVGYTSLPLRANSDTFVSIPVTRPAAYAGGISSTSGNVITLAGSPGLTPSQYKYVQGSQSNTFYAIIGPKLSTISGTLSLTNGSPAVTATAGLSAILPGDELLVNGLAYNVQSVTSDTALVLSRPYTGATGSGLIASYDHSPKEGCFYTISGNGSGTVTVSLNGDSLSSVAPGTTFSVIPYWTLGTAFPAGDAGTSYIASANPKSRGTQILLPDLTDAGTNLASKLIFYNVGGFWQLAGSAASNYYNDTILPPSTYFIVRNGSTATTFTPAGGVYMNRISVPLDAQANIPQDNAVAVTRPTGVTLNDLDLVGSGAFTVTTSVKQRNDVLLTYDNSATGINKSASGIYFYYSGAWRLAGAADPTMDYGSVTLPFGTGFTIRKVANGTGATSFWQNTRNY